MLPAAHRLTDSEAFRVAVRSGRRAGSRTLVVHLASGRTDAPAAPPAAPPAAESPRVGLVVSRAVGNAVLRNRVKRRLRHLAREHLASLPGSAVLVIRALPAAADASYADLGADLRRALAKASGTGPDLKARA